MILLILLCGICLAVGFIAGLVGGFIAGIIFDNIFGQ